MIGKTGLANYDNWKNWWLVGRFREAYPHDTPTPGHLQAMAAIVDGLGSPWNISTNWDRCRWYHTAKGAISFTYASDLASTDSSRLTDLVLAAQLHSVRVEIEPCGPKLMRLIFWPRDPAATHSFDRHPTLDELSNRALDMKSRSQQTKNKRQQEQEDAHGHPN